MKTIIDIPLGGKALYIFRQSSIDDVKDLEEKLEKSCAAKHSILYDEIKGQIKYIKEKFNIEKKDLK